MGDETTVDRNDPELKYLTVEKNQFNDPATQAEWTQKRLVWVPHESQVSGHTQLWAFVQNTEKKETIQRNISLLSVVVAVDRHRRLSPAKQKTKKKHTKTVKYYRPPRKQYELEIKRLKKKKEENGRCIRCRICMYIFFLCRT